MSKITVRDDGSIVSFEGAKATSLYRMRMILTGLKMELRGMRLTYSGPKCSTIVRKEYGLKGKHPELIEQFAKLVDEAAALVPVEVES